MSQTPPPPDDPAPRAALIDDGSQLAIRLLTRLRGELAVRAGMLLTVSVLRRLLRHFLVPAESALRRAVHLLADTLAPPTLRAPKPRPSCHPGERRDPARREGAQPRTPAFRLTESVSRPRTAYIPVNQRPRISVAGEAPAPSAPQISPAARAARLETRLRRRFAALEAACNNPLKAARRLQRLRARGRLRTPALSFVKVPGGHAETLGEAGARLLRELNESAFEAAVRLRLNTS